MPHLTKLAALMCALVSSASYTESGAQSANAATTATVTLVAMSNLPRGATVVVERRASLIPRDVVLVDLDRATARDLAAAVQTLAAVRRRVGDDPRSTLRASPRSYTPPPGFDDSHFGRQMKAGLVRLLMAPETTVAGIGRARSVAITVPVRRPREPAAQN